MYDLVLVHPGGENMSGLQGPYFPIGWLGCASLLEENGYSVRIVDYFLERLRQDCPDAEHLVRQYPARLYGIDLHWFVHSFEAVALAQHVKQHQPDARVILGGLTASYFADDILRECACVDAIVRGDGELPLLRYLEETAKEVPRLSAVPNLSHRLGAEIRHNPIEYVACQEDLDKLDWLDFRSVVHGQDMFYLNNADYSTKAGSDTPMERYLRPKDAWRHWFVYTGRGCLFDCSFCGGSRSAFHATCRRTGVTLRSPRRVAEDVLRLANEMRIDCIYFPHSPFTTPRWFHEAILKSLRESTTKLACGFFFEDVPFHVDWEILQGYMELFDMRKSVIRAYLADDCPDVRAKNNFPVAADTVHALCAYCRDLPVMVQVAVLVGLPGQTRVTCLRMADVLQTLGKDGGYPLVYTGEMHPASLLHREPSAFTIARSAVTFRDFYAHLQSQTNKAMFLGYNTGSDCSGREQQTIIEEALFCPVVTICVDDHADDDCEGGGGVRPDGPPTIVRHRNFTNECMKKITYAHAVGTEEIVFSGSQGFSRCQMPALLAVCRRLHLPATIRCDIKAVADAELVRTLSGTAEITWEIVIDDSYAGRARDDDVPGRTAELATTMEQLRLLDQRVRPQLVVRHGADVWKPLLTALRDWGCRECGLLIDRQRMHTAADGERIRRRFAQYACELEMTFTIGDRSNAVEERDLSVEVLAEARRSDGVPR